MMSLVPNPDAPPAEAERFSLADPGLFAVFCGPQWVGIAGDRAVVMTQETRLADGTVQPGRVLEVDEGWYAVRPRGAAPGNVAFAEPNAVGGALSQWRAG